MLDKHRKWSIAALLLCVTIPINSVVAYSDTRGQSCASLKTINSIPAERRKWYGSIALEVNCRPGYDWPFTSEDKPTPSRIHYCRPDGSEWDPPIFVDCNEIVQPSWLTSIYTVFIPRHICTASALEKSTEKDAKVTVKNGQRTLEFILCPPGSIFKDCSISEAKLVCDAAPEMTQSYIKMTVHISYDKKTQMVLMNLNREKVEVSLHKELTKKGVSGYTVESKYKSVCPPGTHGNINHIGVVVCRGCPLGHYYDPDLINCRMCAPGYYADRPNSTSCQMCPSLAPYENHTNVWNMVPKVVKDGSYTMGLCPHVEKDKAGRLIVKPRATGASTKKLDKGPPSNTGRSSHKLSPLHIVSAAAYIVFIEMLLIKAIV